VSALVWVGVALLGGLGAVARVVLTRTWGGPGRGTLAVNLVGSSAVGLLVGAGVGGDALLLLGGGLLGAFTTFSTWVAEVHDRRSPGLLAGALLLGLGAAALGRVIGLTL
jgi:CrcB protein